MQNCEPIESKLRRRIRGCWREFLRECREKDVNEQGEIATPEFLGLFRFCSLANTVSPPGTSPLPGRSQENSTPWGLAGESGLHAGWAPPPLVTRDPPGPATKQVCACTIKSACRGLQAPHSRQHLFCPVDSISSTCHVDKLQITPGGFMLTLIVAYCLCSILHYREINLTVSSSAWEPHWVPFC